MLQLLKTPKTVEELLTRCQALEGLSLHQLALKLHLTIPTQPLQRKGWVGMVMERFLCTDAGNRNEPDFLTLDIELKTLPINANQEAAESTFITSIPLLTIHQQTWLTSQCFNKLKCILWIPYECDESIPFAQRRIGAGFLWSPSDAEAKILKSDWEELTDLIAMGRINELDARIGQYLQVRPKAQNARSLCYCFDETGDKIQTIPRGFYLRRHFTSSILSSVLRTSSEKILV